jgi:hypothetical protein
MAQVVEPPRANTAWRNAVLKRFRRVLSSSGPPSPGGRTPGRRPRRSGGGESRARARWRADCPAGGTDRTRLRRTEALPYVVALNADATLEAVHVTPAQPEQLPRPRPARAAATTSTRSWRPPRYPGTLGAGPRARRGRGSGISDGGGTPVLEPLDRVVRAPAAPHALAERHADQPQHGSDEVGSAAIPAEIRDDALNVLGLTRVSSRPPVAADSMCARSRER